MTDTNNERPIGTSPITDAASATAPSNPATSSSYSSGAAEVSSNADLRVADNDEDEDAAMSPTGADIDNDHADERPIDRSQDAPGYGNNPEESSELVEEDGDEDKSTEQYTPVE